MREPRGLPWPALPEVGNGWALGRLLVDALRRPAGERLMRPLGRIEFKVTREAAS